MPLPTDELSLVTLAISDPGHFTERLRDLGYDGDEMESLVRWQARAVLLAQAQLAGLKDYQEGEVSPIVHEAIEDIIDAEIEEGEPAPISSELATIEVDEAQFIDDDEIEVFTPQSFRYEQGDCAGRMSIDEHGILHMDVAVRSGDFSAVIYSASGGMRSTNVYFKQASGFMDTSAESRMKSFVQELVNEARRIHRLRPTQYLDFFRGVS